MQSANGLLDVIVEPRYDTATITAPGTLALSYFTVPVGQGLSAFAGAGVAKSYSDTNMDLAGQLPAGYNFDILGFRVMPCFWIGGSVGAAQVTGKIQDANTWSHGGLFTFTIGSKPFLRVPIDTIPAGMGPAGFGSSFTAEFGGAQSHGVPSLDNSFKIGRQPLTLSQTQNFNVVLSWPLVVANTTQFAAHQPAAGIPVRVFMDGFLKRIVQ
ncbi:MAG TPA: hypothetical protein VJL31_12965 [Gemmatimonadales bacterium]|nr:hypothetical protein [Gemmatimonadales bacterium]